MAMRGASSLFKSLFGFEEVKGYQELKDKFALSCDHSVLKSLENNRSFQIGKFATPTLHELRNEARKFLSGNEHKLTYEHMVAGDAFPMHYQYPNAVFQAASQFNCLEFSSSKTTPERGVEIYQYDNTQGPACALACFAGTVYRNYFVDVERMKSGSTKPAAAPSNEQDIIQDTKKLGQTIRNQLNNLDELETLLRNYENNFWYIENGYTFSADQNRLFTLKEYLQQNYFSAGKRDELLSAVKIGVHSNVGVTFESRYKLAKDDVRVTQAYCSALSCAYAGISNAAWAPLARIVLDAAYEATLWAAVIHAEQIDASLTCAIPVDTVFTATEDTCSSSSQPSQSHHRTVFLTFLGGGVFGNDPEWIAEAIGRSLAILTHSGAELNVRICHFRRIDTNMQTLIDASYRNCLNELESR